jgi:hypothetical protein
MAVKVILFNLKDQLQPVNLAQKPLISGKKTYFHKDLSGGSFFNLSGDETRLLAVSPQTVQ